MKISYLNYLHYISYIVRSTSSWLLCYVNTSMLLFLVEEASGSQSRDGIEAAPDWLKLTLQCFASLVRPAPGHNDIVDVYCLQSPLRNVHPTRGYDGQYRVNVYIYVIPIG